MVQNLYAINRELQKMCFIFYFVIFIIFQINFYFRFELEATTDAKSRAGNYKKDKNKILDTF